METLTQLPSSTQKSANSQDPVDWRRRCQEHLIVLAQMLEKRLPYLLGRYARIEAAAQVVASIQEMDPDAAFSLSIAARFHDLGLLCVPDTLLLKQTRLTPEELSLVRVHSQYSTRLVDKLFPDQQNAVEAILYHHERPDGCGPFGLVDGKIPRAAGLIGLLEALESMSHDRPHRPRMHRDEIVAEISRHTGSQFLADASTVVLAHLDQILPVVSSVDVLGRQETLSAL